MNINEKFLKEAAEFGKWWGNSDLAKRWTHQPGAILLESVRLRNEFNGTDEEYKSYLDDFSKRFKGNK